jgi:selenium metabolism protein YedF
MTKSEVKSNTVIQITNDGMGNAEHQLQHKLIKTYFSLLEEYGKLPAAICFYADGVKMVVEGSPVLSELISMQDEGVYLISCQTCLDYYGLSDKVQVGLVGGMTDIIEAQSRADKVINI